MISKVATIVPAQLNRLFFSQSLQAWGTLMPKGQGLSFALARRAIRREQKLHLSYRDQQGALTQRIVWPIALIYYTEQAILVSWCELRQAIRHFRFDRVAAAVVVEQYFTHQGEAKRRDWLALGQEHRADVIQES